jgi:amidohydrolase
MKSIFAAALTLVLCQPVLADTLAAAIASDYTYLEQLYRHLHRNPELSFQEVNTAARIATELRQAGFEVTEKVGGHGIVAVLKNGVGPTVLVRTDLDALPVEEQTDLPYASATTAVDDQGKNVPVMHACGHDIHMTSLVGTARRLSVMRNRWAGTLVMIGQPAEERVQGAQAMLQDGLFTRFPKPDYNLALHVAATMAAGEVGMTEGYALANVDSVDIAVQGVGGHGAYPHTTKDPIVLAAHIIVALQTLVARDISPLESGVVTVGSIHAGTKHNIIPDAAHLQITVRSYTDDVREKLLGGIRRIARGEAIALGLPEDKMPEVTIPESTPATHNDPALTKRIFAALETALGEHRVHTLPPVMGAEDFALYGRTEDRIPSLMFWLGAAKADAAQAYAEGRSKLPSLHSPFFAPDPEPTIKGGVEAMTTAVLSLLGKD